MATIPELNSGRQYALTAVAEIEYSDLTVEVETNVFELPAGAILTAYSLQIVTAFDGTPTIDVGLREGVADCLVDGVSGTAVEAFGESLFGGAFGTTNGDGIDEAACIPAANGDYVTITLHATAPTAGLARLIVEYVVPGRDQENQG